MPRSADTYIHRNGRTARASRNGFSLLMCAPDEKRVVRSLMASIDRGVLLFHGAEVYKLDRYCLSDDEKEVPEMPVVLDLLDKLKSRIQLARKIDSEQHTVKRQKHEKNWLRETAEAMEIDLNSDLEKCDTLC